MGAYFTVIGIKDFPAKEALLALRIWENAEGDPLEVFQCTSGNSVMLCDSNMADAKGLVRGLAEKLHTPVILLEFADDTVWSYALYSASGLEDEFSSRPKYWTDEVDPARFAGNAHKVSEIWGGVTADQIRRYLTDKSLLTEEEGASRAYSNDTAPHWDAWQICDFMQRLGLEYPISAEGELLVQPEGAMTVATELGLEQKAQMKEASAQVDEMLNKLKAEGEWPG